MELARSREPDERSEKASRCSDARIVPAGSLLAWLALASAVGCSARTSARFVSPADLAWPPDDPRIRLERLVELSPAAARGAKLRRWLDLERASTSFARPYAVAWDADDLIVADPDFQSVARIDPRGRIKRSERGLFEQPIGLAICDPGIVVTDPGSGRVALVDRELRLLKWLAQDLSRPTGVCCEGERIFVSETGSHRVLVLGPGDTRQIIGGRGDEPAQFNFPTSLALDRGILLVADAMNFRIQRIDADTGRFLGAFGDLGDSPGAMPRLKGLAIDSARRLWVADAYLDQVAIYDLDGTHLISIGRRGSAPGEFSFPAGIAAHVDGRVVVADSLNRRLVIFRVLDRTRTPAGS